MPNTQARGVPLRGSKVANEVITWTKVSAVRSAIVAVVFDKDVTIVAFIRSPTCSALLATDGAPSTSATAPAAGDPLTHSSATPAALNFAEVVLPVYMTAAGATAVLVAVQVIVGILNSAVTLVAATVGWNTHPPKPVLVPFARLASRSSAGRANRATGPVRARAGTAPLIASSSDPTIATPTPTLRPMRIRLPPCL